MADGVNKNSCGDCTECCSVLPILELKKPAGKNCNFCTIGKGCDFYYSRPKPCRDFNCEYLLSDMTLELRPDKTGVIFERIYENIYLGTVNSNRAITWKNKTVLDYCNRLKDKGISVVITSFTNEKPMILLAEGHSQEGVMLSIKKLIEN